MLEIRDLSVRYGDVTALRGAEFDVAAGEVVGVVGPNGAGKTSLLRALSGLIGPASGEIRFEGKRIDGLAPERIVRLGMGLVPEGRHVFHTLTVAENLSLATTVTGDRGAAVEEMLERFPILRERYRQPADRLSGGEQQQLAIARALLCRPKLLMLDEPSFGLAPKMVDFVFDLLGGLREQGLTMLLVEQNAARTMQFSDRCVVLGSGRMRAVGTRDELTRDGAVLNAYLGGAPPEPAPSDGR